MRVILCDISVTAIKQEEMIFHESQILNNWIGTGPSSEIEINKAQKKLNISLPDEYISFLKITNGFSAPSQIEPTFHSVDDIDYLKNINPFLVELWLSNEDLIFKGKLLEKSIVIGGINEDQYFLLIPIDIKKNIWKYWKFANWIPGEIEYKSLESYFKFVLQSL